MDRFTKGILTGISFLTSKPGEIISPRRHCDVVETIWWSAKAELANYRRFHPERFEIGYAIRTSITEIAPFVVIHKLKLRELELSN